MINEENIKKLESKGLKIPKLISFIENSLHSINIWSSKGKL